MFALAVAFNVAQVWPVLAQSATWLAAPTVTNPDANFNFNANANWTPATVPGSVTQTGTATFGASSGTNISFFSPASTLGGFTFTAAASNYAFANTTLLAFTGAGIVINGGSASFTNNTANGELAFSNASTAGTATITNTNGGRTFFGDTSTAGSATITNNIGFTFFHNNSTAGSAHITNNINGQIAFFDASTAGSGTIISTGRINFANTSTAGSANITNNNGSQTFFNDTTTAGTATITNSNGSLLEFVNTSTAGSATITNNGGMVFNGTSTAGSATITNSSFSGTLFFENTSTAGSATITNNGGQVIFFDNSDGGAAHLINGGGGTIDFSGSAGPLGNNRLGVGSLQGSGRFIVGPQQLVIVSGSLAFTSGALYVVQVSGSSAGQIGVNSTATLAGNVEVDVLTKVTQKTTYTILSSPNPLSGSFGTVSLGLGNNFARNPVLSYTGNRVLLTLDPTLATLLSPSLPANASANQVKVAGAIDNGLLAGNTLSNAFGTIFNLSGNALLNGLTQISGETAVGSQQTTFNAMGQFMGILTDPFMGRGGGLGGSASPIGYAEESGRASANAATDAFAMFAKGSPSQPSPASGGGLGWGQQQGWGQRWSVWASGFGGSQSTGGNAAVGSNDTTSRIAGTAVGADYLLSPNTLAGFALAGGGTNFSVANGGTGRSDLFQMGAYLRHTNGPAYLSAALAYGWQDVTTNRIVTVAGLDQLRAQFNANAWSGRVEGGYRFVVPTWGGGFGITPYAAAQFVTFDLPAYAEQAIIGLNTFALSYGAHAATDPRSELGFRADKSWAMPDGILTLRGRLAWAHDYNPDRAISATIQTLPGASFVVNGAGMAAVSVLTTASVEKRWTNGWSAAATFEGEFSNVSSSYAGKGVVRYQW
jgi:uncharacterized protein with beta-barrel porin domain